MCGLVCFVNEAYPFGLICVCVCDFYMKVCEHLLPETAASVCRCHLSVMFIAERLKQEVKTK